MTNHQPVAPSRRHTFTPEQRARGGRNSVPNFDYRNLIIPPDLVQLYAEQGERR